MSERRETRTEKDATVKPTLGGHGLVLVEYIKITREPQQQRDSRVWDGWGLGYKGFRDWHADVLGFFGDSLSHHWQATAGIFSRASPRFAI